MRKDLMRLSSILAVAVATATLAMGTAAATETAPTVNSDATGSSRYTALDPRPDVHVTGRVLDLNSQVPADEFGTVTVKLDGVEFYMSHKNTTIDSEGYYAFSNLVPGQYRLKVGDPVFSPGDKFQPYESDLFEVGPEGTVTMADVHLKLKGVIEGTVTVADPSDYYYGNISVKMTDTDGDVSSTTVDTRTGYYRLMAQKVNATYTVTATPSSARYLPVERTLSLKDGETLREDFALPFAGSATGRLVGPEGTPSHITDRWDVRVRDENGNAVRDVDVIRGENGEYTLRGFDTGTYTITYFWHGPYMAYRFAEVRNVKAVRGETTAIPDVVTDAKYAPSSPGNSVATATPESAALRWAIPGDNSKYQPTHWIAQQSTDGGVTWNDADLVGAVRRDYVGTGTVRGLDSTKTYVFRVAQVNDYGTSLWGKASNSIVPLAAPEPTPEPVKPAPVVPHPVAPPASPLQQHVLGKPKSVKVRSTKSLPKQTDAGVTIKWRSATPSVCKVKGGKLVAGKRAGTCRVVGHAAGSATHSQFDVAVKIRVHR